jgi:long-chain fatty acid transport protein
VIEHSSGCISLQRRKDDIPLRDLGWALICNKLRVGALFGRGLRPFSGWAIAVALVNGMIPSTSHAAGFAIDYEGARALGMATAGSAAAEDATTIFYNPAGMTFLRRDQAIVGGDIFLLHDRFSNSGSTILGGTMATPGDNGLQAISPAVLPWLYAAHRVSDDVVVGVGLFAPAGLRTDYGQAFVGRYQNILTSLTAIDLNPSVAYRPWSWLSLGGGITLEYASLRLTQALDFGSGCAAALGIAACQGAFNLSPGRNDGITQLSGHTVSPGFNIGALAELLLGTRLGVAYRSGTTNYFNSATETFSVAPNARAFLTAAGMPAALTGSSAATKLQLPGRISFGLRQEFSKELELLFDATLTMWNVFKTTNVTAANPITGVNVTIDQNYHDAWRFALGGSYNAAVNWIMRAGIAYDQTPVPLSMVQAALPDRDRVYLTLGTSVQLSRVWALDVGYSRVKYVASVPINRLGSMGDRLLGNFSVGGDILAVQLKAEFN